jgi:hypothetical protein
MGVIHLIDGLPNELERSTCTCRRYRNWDNDTRYSDSLGILVHGFCGKPEQDKVVYQCTWCDDLFISTTLRPCTQRPEPYAVSSVIYIARSKNYFPVKDVFCSNGCEAGFNKSGI